jgi:hypothetical protein
LAISEESKAIKASQHPTIMPMGNRQEQIGITVEIKGNMANKMNVKGNSRELLQRWRELSRITLTKATRFQQWQEGDNEIFGVDKHDLTISRLDTIHKELETAQISLSVHRSG